MELKILFDKAVYIGGDHFGVEKIRAREYAVEKTDQIDLYCR